MLFGISAMGIYMNRKNVLVLLMSIELMLLAVNFNFIAFSQYLGDTAGQIFVFFVLTVAAAESAIGLAIMVLVFRNRQTINVADLDTLKGWFSGSLKGQNHVKRNWYFNRHEWRTFAVFIGDLRQCGNRFVAVQSLFALTITRDVFPVCGWYDVLEYLFCDNWRFDFRICRNQKIRNCQWKTR